MEIEITEASKEVFREYAKDAGNWSGNPWVSEGNIQPTKAQRGNLGDLVKKGLIEIHESDKQKYIIFTEAGIKYAETLGIDLTWVRN